MTYCFTKGEENSVKTLRSQNSFSRESAHWVRKRNVMYQPMPPGFKIVFTAIALSLSSIAPALAQTSIQNLPNGNYRYCSNPPSSSDVNDIDIFAGGHCFLFRKSGDQVVGYFWDMSTSGEVGVCATGTVNRNTVNGKALEYVFDVEKPVEPRFKGTQPVNWDDNGYLKVAGASATYDSEQGIVSTTILYSTAVLNLNEFYRYNAGTQLPPTSCQR